MCTIIGIDAHVILCYVFARVALVPIPDRAYIAENTERTRMVKNTKTNVASILNWSLQP